MSWMNWMIIHRLNDAGEGFVRLALPMLIQSSILIVFLLLLDRVLRKKVRAVFRYAMWMLVLVKLVLPTTLWSPTGLGHWLGDTLDVTVANRTEIVPAQAAPQIAFPERPVIEPIADPQATVVAPLPPVRPVEPTAVETAIQPAPVAPAATIATTEPPRGLTWQGIVLLGYAAIVVAMILLLVQRSRFVSGLVAQSKEPNGVIRDMLAYCRGQMGVRASVPVKISPNMVSPAACGLVRPTILIPEYLPSQLGTHHLRTVMLHELAHVKRGDLWVNLVQTLLQIVYFYHPLLWLANTMIRRVREQAVDEMVLVALGEQAREYPETLVSVARLAIARPALSLRFVGVVESKSALAGRVRHILNRPIPKTAKLGLLGSAVILLIAAVLLPMAKATPKTEAAETIPVPQLTAESRYVAGERILIKVKAPYRKGWWSNIDAGLPSDDKNWAWYMRVNGKEYRCRLGVHLFGGPTEYQFDLTDHLDSQIDFPPGKYRVAYLYKNVYMTSPQSPDKPIHVDTLATNEVQFEVVTSETAKGVSASLPSRDEKPAEQADNVWQAIQLVGVCPDGGNDLLDAEGKLIGEIPGLGPLSPWHPNEHARTLVFDIPQTPDLQWMTFPELYVSGTGRRLGGYMPGWTADFKGKKQRILALTIDRTYQESGWLRNRTVAIDRIDVTLKYYLPGRRKAMCTFLGPFETEKTFRPQEGQDCVLKLMGPLWRNTERGISFHISGSIDFDDQQVLAYDVAGNRYLVHCGGGRTVSGKRISVEENCYVHDLPFSRLAAITLGEKPEEKTFRNILVRYPDRPARDYAEYLDKLASTLGLAGLSPEQLWEYRFKSADEALKVIDIVRGNHIERAWQAINKYWGDFAALPQDVQDKLRRTAKTWADNGNFFGIVMGLKGQWPEFVAPALEMLHEDKEFRGEVANSLGEFYRQLTPQELDQIAVVLEQRDDPRGLDRLLHCLGNSRQRPGGQEALLRLARSEKVWLWWPALRHLTISDGLTLGQLTRDLQVKQLARTNPELGGNPAMAAEARALLAKLPTAHLAAMSPETFSEVIRSVVTNLPRAEAQAVLLDLLQDRVDHWWDYEVKGYSPSKGWVIDCAVRQLNNWNNLNLGGVGQDVNGETSQPGRIDWPALAKEVLTHFGRTSATQPGKKTDMQVESESGSPASTQPATLEAMGNLQEMGQPGLTTQPTTSPVAKTPLHAAAENGHAEMIQLLLSKGADVNARTASGYTPLHLAAKNGHELCARILLDAGANVNAQSDNGETPLYLAAGNGHGEMVQLLVARGATMGQPGLTTQPATTPSTGPAGEIQERHVGKTVSSFPKEVDLSTPESALAAYHRASGRMDAQGVVDLSWVKITPSETERFWERERKRNSEGLDIYNQAQPDAEIIDVLTWNDTIAAVISYLPFPEGKGRDPYSVRSFGLIDGEWKNLGEDRCPSLEAGKENVRRKKDGLGKQFDSIRKKLIARQAASGVSSVSPSNSYSYPSSSRPRLISTIG